MDFETVEAADFGRSLQGVGLNLLTRDVRALAGFLHEVFGMEAHRISDDFAIITYGNQLFQLHGDQTYHSHPLPALLPEAGARGAGIEIRLYDTDPDQAQTRAKAAGHDILQPASDKPHGLREVYIMSPEGYVWVASRRL